MMRFIKIADIVLILSLILSSMAVMLLLAVKAGVSSEVVIEVNGKPYARYDLSVRTVKIETEFGSNTLEIRNDRVGMIEASCPEGHYEYISKPYQTIVCIPNRIIVWLEGSKSDTDAVTY